MTTTSSAPPPTALRYARALFALAEERGATDAIGDELTALGELIAGHDELRRLIANPLIDAVRQQAVFDAILKKAKASELLVNFVRVVIRNRRLALLPAMITAYAHLQAEARGETAAEVTSAVELSAGQERKIAALLKEALGNEVRLENRVDPAILGGLVLRIGSRMIDASLRSRLQGLKTTLKGA